MLFGLFFYHTTHVQYIKRETGRPNWTAVYARLWRLLSFRNKLSVADLFQFCLKFEENRSQNCGR